MKFRLTFCLLAALSLSIAAAAGEVRPYTDPLPLGDYVADVDQLLLEAYRYDGWQPRDRIDDNTYLAFISYKGYDITVRIEVRDNNLSLRLVTVFETGCGDNCRHLGEENVIQWLVNLRRTIAYVLTTKIRDRLREQAG